MFEKRSDESSSEGEPADELVRGRPAASVQVQEVLEDEAVEERISRRKRILKRMAFWKKGNRENRSPADAQPEQGSNLPKPPPALPPGLLPPIPEEGSDENREETQEGIVLRPYFQMYGTQAANAQEDHAQHDLEEIHIGYQGDIQVQHHAQADAIPWHYLLHLG